MHNNGYETSVTKKVYNKRKISNAKDQKKLYVRMTVYV